MRIKNILMIRIGYQAFLLILLFLIISANFSCKKFLDAKPSSALAKLSVNDLQGLLDDYDTMNNGYPCDGELSSDNYFLSAANLSSLFAKDERDLYIWKAEAQSNFFGRSSVWSIPYKVVYNANLILETINDQDTKSLTQETINTLKGSALFFRAYAHFQIAQVFAKTYNSATASQDLGIPIRNSTAIEIKSERSTIQNTYNQIISDFQNAITLLPVTSTIQSRPNKVAAYAALARTYISMEDYVNAGKMADESLKLNKHLIDYNTISQTSITPFSRFNDEVLFQSKMFGSFAMLPTAAKIDPELYISYQNNDLRKRIFFKENTGANAGTYRFSGNYDPVTTAHFFDGLATDEVYLIRAECYARAGNTQKALDDLNTLLTSRWLVTKDADDKPVSTYTPYETMDANVALGYILNERRKELIFRGIRWSDLRRLNKSDLYKTDLVRKQNGTEAIIATLPANDLRYTLLIPQQVIDATGFLQNPR